MKVAQGCYLEEVAKGVYTANGWCWEGDSATIAVHPYFDFYETLVEQRRHPHDIGEVRPTKYLENLEAHLQFERGPILLFEESQRVPFTLRRFEKMGVCKNVFVIPTVQEDPRPTSGWDGPLSFIEQYVGPKGADIVGMYYFIGYVWDSGCVKIVMNKVAQRGIPFLPRWESIVTQTL